MILQLGAWALLAGMAAGGAGAYQYRQWPPPQPTERRSSQDHVAWVAEVLTRMQTIGPGMTREALLKVFRREGGISTGMRRTYVSRDCPYFKVDVDFQAAGQPSRDENGREGLIEGSQDIILKISRPYLGFSYLD